jgi:hypothetical protein
VIITLVPNPSDALCVPRSKEFAIVACGKKSVGRGLKRRCPFAFK